MKLQERFRGSETGLRLQSCQSVPAPMPLPEWAPWYGTRVSRVRLQYLFFQIMGLYFIKYSTKNEQCILTLGENVLDLLKYYGTLVNAIEMSFEICKNISLNIFTLFTVFRT